MEDKDKPQQNEDPAREELSEEVLGEVSGGTRDGRENVIPDTFDYKPSRGDSGRRWMKKPERPNNFSQE